MKSHHRPLLARTGAAILATLALLSLLGAGSYPAGQASASTAAPALAQAAGTQDTLVLHVYFRDTDQRDRLATGLGAEGADTRGGYLTVLADREMYATLLARGLRVEIDEQATKEANTPVVFGNTFYGGYHTVEEMEQFLDQMASAYPSLAEKVDLGDSWCKTHPGQCTQPNSWNGFDMLAMHVGNRNIPGPKPVLWVDGGIHAREIATPEVAMQFIQWLLSGYNTNADARWLVDYHDIWVMPSMNPDGHHMVESGGNNPTYHRKNADNDDGCNTYDDFGVDINRNYDFMWGCCGGSTPYPCDDTYRGPSANSEEETQAVASAVMQLIPDQRGPDPTDPAPITTTGALINLHANAALNIYPWGWTSQHAPNRDEMYNIGARMGASVAYGGNNYESCQSAECLYTVDGDEKNWGYGVLGIPSYSVEVNGSGFFPTYQFTMTDIWPRNRSALTYIAKISRAPYLQTRGPDALTSATMPMTVTLGSAAHLTATTNYNWTGAGGLNHNLYLQNVAAAEYYIDTPPWAGGTPVAMVAVDGSFDSPTEAVEASIDTAGLTPGRHILFVRGRGVTSYQGFESWGPAGAVFLDVVTGGVTPTVPPATATTPPSTPTPLPPTATATIVPVTQTPTPCSLSFSDVPPENTFYPYVMCLACRGVVSGYGDGTFRPNNPVTRGQLAKIVSNSAGFAEDPGEQIFEDVQPDSTFYAWINRLARRGIMSGYPCGGPGEPCGSGNLPYFRPFSNATRGQTAKIVSNAAGLNDPVSGQTFEDVSASHPFYEWIERLAMHGVMGGYPCGGVGEPCGPTNLPYFRPYNSVTRGQSAKIVANTFFPSCAWR